TTSHCRRESSRRARRLRGAADATPPPKRASSGADARDPWHRTRAAARARDLAGGARDGAAEVLDLGGREPGAQPGHADRGLGTAVRAEDRAAHAHDALGRLLEVDRVAAAADRRELGLEARDRRDGVLRATQERSGCAVEVIDLVVGK